MKDKLIGIDVGTTGCKVSLFSFSGETLSSWKKDYPTHSGALAEAEQDPSDWWDAVTRGILHVTADVSAGDIAAVGISCMAPVLLPLDSSGNSFAGAQIWLDRRCASLIPEMEEKYGKERFHHNTGNLLKPGYLLPKLYWLKKNRRDIYDRAVCFLQPDGYIAYRLTGRLCMNKSHCELTCMNELPGGEWSKEICGLFGIDTAKLPEIIDTDSIAGFTVKETKGSCGLPDGIPVVTGGHDSAMSSFALGITAAGQSCLDIGNSSNLISVTAGAVRCEQSDFYRHPINGLWLFQIYSGTTGAAFRWLRGVLGRGGENDEASFARLVEAAAAARPGCGGLIFTPYFCGSQYNSDHRALWLDLTLETAREEMIRAVMEGCSLSVRLNMETMEQAAGFVIDDIVLTGGGSNDPFWAQMHADILGRTLKTRSLANAAVFGAAMFARQAALGIPYLPSFGEEKIYTPNPEDKNIYDKNYAEFRKSLFGAGVTGSNS